VLGLERAEVAVGTSNRNSSIESPPAYLNKAMSEAGNSQTYEFAWGESWQAEVVFDFTAIEVDASLGIRLDSDIITYGQEHSHANN